MMLFASLLHCLLRHFPSWMKETLERRGLGTSPDSQDLPQARGGKARVGKAGSPPPGRTGGLGPMTTGVQLSSASPHLCDRGRVNNSSAAGHRFSRGTNGIIRVKALGKYLPVTGCERPFLLLLLSDGRGWAQRRTGPSKPTPASLPLSLPLGPESAAQALTQSLAREHS